MLKRIVAVAAVSSWPRGSLGPVTAQGAGRHAPARLHQRPELERRRLRGLLKLKEQGMEIAYSENVQAAITSRR